MSVGASLDANADHSPAVEPSVAAARTALAMRVRALLLEAGPLDAQAIAERLGVSSARVMFAVRELEQLGMAAVEHPVA
jgi:predicted ArsR family transcriptional regulator